MKHPTLQKVMLLTVALASSLALSVQAGRPDLSTAKQTHGPGNGGGHLSTSAPGSGQVRLPFSTYVLDDGSAEDAIGLTLGGDIISLNEFAVIPGSETINSVSIAWGTPINPDSSLNGLPYTVAVWSDPNGDGNPNDAVLLTTASGVVSSAGTDTFITTAITPTTITTANFFVGFLITHAGGQFPAAFDETAPTFSNRSYVAGGAVGNINNLNMNDLPVAAIESFGLIGNWLVQATSGDNGTPTPTPTPPCSWSAGPDLPSVGARLAGVHFPANGKFYGMGGRSADAAGSEFTHPFEYDPVASSWTTKSATYPDIQVNNIACGVLNESGTDYIYCVGGSDVASQTTTGRVFRYDPVTDTLSSVGAPWPPGAATTTLPGGFTVSNNKFYILGGFNIPGGNAITDIWEFDPTTNAWVQKNAALPVPLAYIPTTTIGSLIYTGGGSDITGGALTDTTNSFVYDPVADSISTIASIPRATGETRALNFNGQMLVMGGGRTPPNPSNEVDVYDPGTNTWSTSVPPFTVARRNFPVATDGTSHIWLAGGYDSSGTTLLASMEIFECTTSGEITLSASARGQGGKRRVALSWTPADGGSINIVRDGVVIHTTTDDGRGQDHLGRGPKEVHTYQVCETDTGNCSNEVKVKIPGNGGQ